MNTCISNCSMAKYSVALIGEHATVTTVTKEVPWVNDIRPCRRKLPIRRGASALEMAIMLPLLFLMVFGIIEFGRAIMVHQVLVNSAREATRRAVIPGATDAQVLATVTKSMNSAGITGYSVGLTIDGTSATLDGSSSSITNAPAKSSIGLKLSVTNSNVSWGVMNLVGSGRIFAAGVEMRKEG